MLTRTLFRICRRAPRGRLALILVLTAGGGGRTFFAEPDGQALNEQTVGATQAEEPAPAFATALPSPTNVLAVAAAPAAAAELAGPPAPAPNSTTSTAHPATTNTAQRSTATAAAAPTTTTTRQATSTTTRQAAATSPAPRPEVNYGWELTAANTGLAGAGVDRASLPPFDGNITPGMTLSRVKITGGVDLTDLPDVTLDQVWLHPTGTNRALILGPGTIIKDSDIDGSAMPRGERWGLFHGDTGGAEYSIARVSITGVSIGAWLDGSAPGTMTDTYIRDLISTADAHLDGFTRRSGTGPLTIARSRIADDYTDGGGTHATGSVFLQNTWGGKIGGITIRDTFLEGNGFNLALENRGASTSIGVNNLRLRPTEYDAVSTQGPVDITDWTDVFLYDADKPNAAGRAVARP